MAMVTHRGRSVYEAVLRIFTVDPRHNDLFELPGLALPNPAIRAALEWFVKSGDQNLSRKIERALQRSTSTEDSAETIMQLATKHYKETKRHPSPMAEYRPPLWETSETQDILDLAAFTVGRFLGAEEIGSDRIAEIITAFVARNSRIPEKEMKDGLNRLKSALIAQETSGLQPLSMPKKLNMQETIDRLSKIDIKRIREVRNKLAFVANMGHLFLSIGGSGRGEPMVSRMLEASTKSTAANFLLHLSAPIAVTLESNAWNRMTAAMVMILTDDDEKYANALDELAFAAVPERFSEMSG
ncbi:hypothetical protein [Streptomyces rubiginosohelvolus]